MEAGFNAPSDLFYATAGHLLAGLLANKQVDTNSLLRFHRERQWLIETAMILATELEQAVNDLDDTVDEDLVSAL